MFSQLFEKLAALPEEELIGKEGRIAPFGNEFEQAQAVLDGRKTISSAVRNSEADKQFSNNPNLKSIVYRDYIYFYKPENESDALSRIREIEDIASDVCNQDGATREQMIRLGELFDYSKEDINAFLVKVGYPTY